MFKVGHATLYNMHNGSPQLQVLCTNLQKWICRMDLDPGTYALVPFTSGCHLQALEEENHTPAFALSTTKEGRAVLTPECQKALEEVFHRIDLDGNGCISRMEFDFFQEVTSGELCDDDAWNIILS